MCRFLDKKLVRLTLHCSVFYNEIRNEKIRLTKTEL